jgi:hypothetical protein
MRFEIEALIGGLVPWLCLSRPAIGDDVKQVTVMEHRFYPEVGACLCSGRPSDSGFLYFLEPDGLTLEYSFGIEEFPELDPRAPRHLDPTPLNVDLLGSCRDPRISATGEIAVHRIPA